MPRVNSSQVALAYAPETDFGERPGAGWELLEPNSIGSYGSEITTVPRTPIGVGRKPQKGSITDLTAGVEFEADLTFSAFRDFAAAFLFTQAVNREWSEVRPSAITSPGSTALYTIPATVPARPAGVGANHLVYATGFKQSGNNGLKKIRTAMTATTIPVAGLVAEAIGGDDQPRVSVAGYRVLTTVATSWTWDSSTKRATLLTGGNDPNWDTMRPGLTPGQYVHIGSLDDSGDVQNALQNTAANDMYGYARVVSVSPRQVIFDKVDTRLQHTVAAIATDVDVLFGEFVRDRASDHSDYKETSFHFELAYPRLGGTEANPTTEYEYVKGNYPNTVAITLPLADKATMSFGFVGTNAGSPGARGAGVDPVRPLFRSAMNTSSDIARLRIAEVDESGTYTDFKSLTVNINNNVTPEGVLGRLGGKYINFGTLEMGIEAQLVFTNGSVIDRIRRNLNMSLDFVLSNEDGVAVVDFPELTLGGGGRSYPENESVLIDVTGAVHESTSRDYVMGISTIPVPLSQGVSLDC